MPNITPTEERLLNVTVNPPSKAEIEQALKQLNNGKVAAPDDIPPTALKTDPKTTSAMLHPLFLQIWEIERVPTERKNGYLVKLPKKGDLGLCKNWRGIMLLSVPSKVFWRIILERFFCFFVLQSFISIAHNTYISHYTTLSSLHFKIQNYLIYTLNPQYPPPAPQSKTKLKQKKVITTIQKPPTFLLKLSYCS